MLFMYCKSPLGVSNSASNTLTTTDACNYCCVSCNLNIYLERDSFVICTMFGVPKVKILKEKSLHEYTVQIERAQFSLQNLNGQLMLERKGMEVKMEVNNQQLRGHNM